MTDPSVLLIGGPETGKSNFLFKAWNCIFSMLGVLEMDGLPADAEYLQDGAACQMRGEYAGHTTQAVQVISYIPIQMKGKPEQKATLVVPDVDGEQINRIYRERRWSAEWEDLVDADSAFLFFVRINSDLLVVPLDWIACHDLYGFKTASQEVAAEFEGQRASTLTTGPKDPAPDRPTEGSKALDGSKTEAPTQIVLVDLIQFILTAIREKCPNPPRTKVGFVLTGWDSVPVDFVGGPAAWIQDNMPFLAQFLDCNRDVLDFEYFGSSVFSGDPENNQEYLNEMSHKDPRTLGYIKVGASDSAEPDFTIPIAWALGWESRS